MGCLHGPTTLAPFAAGWRGQRRAIQSGWRKLCRGRFRRYVFAAVRQIWSVLDFKPKTPRLWHQDGILDAVFSPDGRTLATAGEDEAVRIWNSSSGAPLTPSLPQPAKVDHVIFSPDSQLLLVSCRTSWLRVFHVATGQLVCDPIPFGGSVALAEFTQGSDGVNYAAPDGSITTVPLHLPPSPLITFVQRPNSSHTIAFHRLVSNDWTLHRFWHDGVPHINYRKAEGMQICRTDRSISGRSSPSVMNRCGL